MVSVGNENHGILAGNKNHGITVGNESSESGNKWKNRVHCQQCVFPDIRQNFECFEEMLARF